MAGGRRGGRTALFVCLGGVPLPGRAPGPGRLGGPGERQCLGGAPDVWDRQPRASVLLATGRGFDVLEVPESAGCHALARTERMDVELGPVIAAPTGRMAFFVLPGARAKAPGLLAALGWLPGALDLTVRGEGDWVAAPPTRMGRGGRAQWVRRPTAANRWLPDIGALLSPLAYACGRAAAEARAVR